MFNDKTQDEWIDELVQLIKKEEMEEARVAFDTIEEMIIEKNKVEKFNLYEFLPELGFDIDETLEIINTFNMCYAELNEIKELVSIFYNKENRFKKIYEEN